MIEIQSFEVFDMDGESFDIRGHKHNIAIITMKEKLKFDEKLHPVCIPSMEDDYENKDTHVFGYGKLEDDKYSKVLMMVTVKVHPNTACSNIDDEQVSLNCLTYKYQYILGLKYVLECLE